MKNHITPLAIALSCAFAIHMLVIALLNNSHWFDLKTPNEIPANFEVSLLPASASAAMTSPPEQPHQDTTTNQEEAISLRTSQANINEPFAMAKPSSEQISNPAPIDLDQMKKSTLLDLSKISLSPHSSEADLKGVFSPRLQAQIEASKAAQKEYLKGQIKETDYPITKDADGTRYVNIKGVCWRLPKEGSHEAWAIVFAGCNGQTESFHFELNINPGMFLGPDSPFSIGQ